MEMRSTDDAVLIGRYDVLMDSSGMITIPEEWRFITAPAVVVWVMPDEDEEGLFLVPDARMPAEYKQVACRLVVDAGFRISIPEDLRNKAGLSGSVAMVGCVRVVKLCNPEVLAKDEPSDLDDILKVLD